MKVAINAWFHNQINTGSGQYLRYLIPALAKQAADLEIVLITPDFGLAEDNNTDWPAGVEILPVATKPSNLGKVWFEQMRFPQAARAARADLAHVPYFGSALVPQLPTVVTLHDIIPMILPEYRGGAPVRLYTALAGASAGSAALVLADSESSRRDILSKLRFGPGAVRTVYLAPAPHYHPAQTEAEIAAIHAKYHLPEKFALYIGGFDRRKNLSTLLAAWKFVQSGLGDDLSLVLAGRLPEQDTPFFPDPLKMARELGVAETIITPGWVDEADKPLLYSAARLFVYPSAYEGFGLPVLEAMACGTPVVTTNVSSLPELVGAHAFQINPDDSRGMAAAIIALAVQDETRRDMSERGLKQAGLFSWAQTARQTLQAYKDVYSGRV